MTNGQEQAPRYRPRSVQEAPSEAFRQLVQAAKQRRLVLYLGAGVSVGVPSCGPTGSAVADRLRPAVARMLNVETDELVGDSLEALAQRVENQASESLPELRDQAATSFDFRGMEPNFAHDATALLIREGLAEVASVNWDCGVERAGLRAGVPIRGVATAAQRIQLVDELPLFKVHGCARHPPTLALTQSEVDAPQSWAVALVQNSLAGGVVVFVGLGTVGLYVREPIDALLDTWTSEGGPTVIVVDPHLSEQWKEALRNRSDDVHLGQTANEFFDDFLRAIVRNAMSEVAQAVTLLAAQDDWAEPMRSGYDALRAALEEATGESVLHWWRDGVIDTFSGRPFITELSGQRALMTVAFLVGADKSAIHVQGSRHRLTIGTERQYFEVVCRPGQHVGQVDVVARERIARRFEDGLYEGGRMVTVVVSDAIGEFPASDAPQDIAAGLEESKDIAGPSNSLRVRLVAAEDGVQGRLT